MPFRNVDGVHFYQFDIFPAGIAQAVFTRRGGVSPAPWDSLNVGGTVGDARERVVENRLRSFRALGRDPQSMFDVWQVHSADVVVANAPHNLSPPEFKADAIITDNPAVTLFMRFADCVPILLHDPVKNAVGIVHAGWQGTVKRAAGAAVQAMRAAYGTRPQDVLAAIGPSIGPDHYEVGEDVVARVRETFGEGSGLLTAHQPKPHFNLWQANLRVLQDAGVEKVEVSGLCTACDLTHWYSHRGQQGKAGRFGALIAL